MYAKIVASGKGDVEPEGHCWGYGMFPFLGLCVLGAMPYWWI